MLQSVIESVLAGLPERGLRRRRQPGRLGGGGAAHPGAPGPAPGQPGPGRGAADRVWLRPGPARRGVLRHLRRRRPAPPGGRARDGRAWPARRTSTWCSAPGSAQATADGGAVAQAAWCCKHRGAAQPGRPQAQADRRAQRAAGAHPAGGRGPADHHERHGARLGDRLLPRPLVTGGCARCRCRSATPTTRAARASRCSTASTSCSTCPSVTEGGEREMLIQVLLVLAVLLILFVFVRSSNAVYVQASKRVALVLFARGQRLRGDAARTTCPRWPSWSASAAAPTWCCTRWWWRSWPACSASTSGSGWSTGATPSWPARWPSGRPRWSTPSAGCARPRPSVAVAAEHTEDAVAVTARWPGPGRSSTSCSRTSGGWTWPRRPCAACWPRTTRAGG